MESTNQDTPTTQATNTASSPTQTGAANPGSTEAKFTQADIDRILNEKLEKAPQKEARIKAELLKQLGLAEDADFEAVKSTITKARDIELANLSAVEKAEKLLADEKKRADDALAQLSAERAERRNDRIAQAIAAKAASMKANDTEDVLLYAREKHKDELAAVIDDSGAIDDKKLTALLEKVKAAKGHYFTPPVSVPGSRSNNEGSRIPSDAEAMKRFSMNNQRAIRGR